MKFKKLVVSLLLVLALVVAVFLPALVGSTGGASLVGPDLSSLRFREIEFGNGDLHLAGMLFVPEGEGPYPVAVIIHGSGTSSRNNAWYLSVTRHLQDNGVAVLLPDKRGSEKSEGNWVGANFNDLASDTMAAVEFIRGAESVPCSSIGLVGMSQGGWIAPIVASEDRDIGFVVSMSASTVPVTRQILHEEIHNISEHTWPVIARMLAPITTRRILRMDHVKAYSAYDPIPFWKQVDADKFFAFGGDDPNVPVDESLEALRSNSIGGRIEVYPEGGHAISDSRTRRVQSAFLDDLVDFIGQSKP
jgi:dipeptidyl aminopeptidase/acylaminoacyl peptidase